MELIVEKTERLEGEVTIPGSKSHTIRAVVIASLAKGTSKITKALKSEDTMAAVNACRALGAKIDTSNEDVWIVEGFDHKPKSPQTTLDMANSGVSLRLITGIVAALCDSEVKLDGDELLRKRPIQPLLSSFNDLGAEASSIKNDGCCPIQIKGRMTGGSTKISGITSQYVSSLLFACPLLEKDSQVSVIEPNEIPFIRLTLKWLDEQGIRCEASDDLTKFIIYGNQKYKAFEKRIPADWSSAAFPIVGAAITDSDVLVKGLQISDVQGDKAIIEYLQKMQADISIEEAGIRIKGRPLQGTAIDLNNTPDALPALAVLGCFADGTTSLKNVEHARIKETDRITIMKQELSKLNADISESKDGLVIHKSELKANNVEGYHDHRVVMALSLAGLIASGKTKITTAEAVKVTYPEYVESMKSLGAKMEVT